MRNKLTPQDVLAAALEIGETERPTSDLLMHLRQKHGVSDRACATAYEKVLDLGYMHQVEEIRWADGHQWHCTVRTPVSFTHWEITPEGQAVIGMED